MRKKDRVSLCRKSDGMMIMLEEKRRLRTVRGNGNRKCGIQNIRSNERTNFMVTPCINNAELFYYQLMHITLKNTELLKHSKITLQHVSVYIETIFRELKSVLG